MVKVKRAGIGTKMLVLILLAASVVALLSMRAQLKTAQGRRDQLSQQVQAQLETNAALADSIAHSGDPEYLANVGRDKLGLLEPDEIRFVDTSN